MRRALKALAFAASVVLFAWMCGWNFSRGLTGGAVAYVSLVGAYIIWGGLT